ncbi:MAG TPA: FmdB family zinc ribbon protein [Terracidiphilus sp.]|nr:FmdB family zinc ribbon protein [Terracidiphilus sp.]
MPLYEYRCTQCGHRFEKIQSFNAEPETECPKCHGVLMRPLTAPALQFKGAGWYVNDYAPKAASGSTDSKPADSGAASNTGSGSESKPAAAETSAKPAASESASSSSSSESSSKSPTTSTT